MIGRGSQNSCGNRVEKIIASNESGWVDLKDRIGSRRKRVVILGFCLVSGWLGGWVDGPGGWVDRWVGGWIDGWVGRWVDG